MNTSKVVPFITATLRKNGVQFKHVYNNKRKHVRHIKVYDVPRAQVDYVLRVMRLAGLRKVEMISGFSISMRPIYSVQGYTLHH